MVPAPRAHQVALLMETVTQESHSEEKEIGMLKIGAIVGVVLLVVIVAGFLYYRRKPKIAQKPRSGPRGGGQSAGADEAYEEPAQLQGNYAAFWL